jgi:hypothetical protein
VRGRLVYLSIDPGIDTAWAVFSDVDHMVACGLGNPRPGHLGSVIEPGTVLIEKPQIYQARNMKGNPNDIVTLAINVGQYKEAWEQVGRRVRLCTPHEWKGTQHKDVNNNITLAGLSVAERAIVVKAATYVPKSKQHNILDAIGLGRAGFHKRLW